MSGRRRKRWPPRAEPKLSGIKRHRASSAAATCFPLSPSKRLSCRILSDLPHDHHQLPTFTKPAHPPTDQSPPHLWPLSPTLRSSLFLSARHSHPGRIPMADNNYPPSYRLPTVNSFSNPPDSACVSTQLLVLCFICRKMFLWNPVGQRDVTDMQNCYYRFPSHPIPDSALSAPPKPSNSIRTQTDSNQHQQTVDGEPEAMRLRGGCGCCNCIGRCCGCFWGALAAIFCCEIVSSDGPSMIGCSLAQERPSKGIGKLNELEAGRGRGDNVIRLCAEPFNSFRSSMVTDQPAALLLCLVQCSVAKPAYVSRTSGTNYPEPSKGMNHSFGCISSFSDTDHQVMLRTKQSSLLPSFCPPPPLYFFLFVACFHIHHHSS